MTDESSRLLSDQERTAVARVLGSGLEDAPSAAAVARAARSLGIAPAVALTAAKAAAVSSASAAPTTLGGAAAAAHVTPLLWGTLAKWLGLGLLAGSVTSFSVTRLPIARGDAEAAPSSRASARPEPEPVARVAVHPPIEPVPAVSGTVTPAASAGPAERRELSLPVGSSSESRSLRVVQTVPAPLPASSLERELARLDQARRAVNAHEPERALEALAAYERELDAPALRAEATLLRVQALVAAGRLPEAQREVEGVLSNRPHDGYTCRLTRLAALGDSGCVVASDAARGPSP